MKHFLILAAVLSTVAVSAQIRNPVKWASSYAKVDAQTYDLTFTATIEKGWYVYSHYLEEGGPIPTSFTFKPGDHYQLAGKLEEKSRHRKAGFDAIFEMEVVKYAEEVTFVQRVKVRNPALPITGYLEYMTCDDEQCLPPTEEDFSIQLPAAAAPSSGAEPKTGDERGENPDGDATGKTSAGAAAAPATGDLARSGAFRDAGSPATWTAELRRLDAREYELAFHVQLDEGWYTYSMFLDGDGPVPTSIKFTEGGAEAAGAPRESGPARAEEHDPTFDMVLVKFKQEATFRQTVRLNDPARPFAGFVEFMACNAVSCLPPVEAPFRVDPQAMTITLGEGLPLVGDAPPATTDAIYDYPGKPDLENPVGQCGETATVAATTGYWGIFALGFLGGLLALLTPCVFPMIPLTVSFFTKSSQNRRRGIINASLYGLFILLVYLILSLPFHLMDSINPDILNDISTNVWLNVAFFVIFLVFAFSFFGYYELTLPSSWANRVSHAEGIGGMLGIFFMALTLALVSFSCTGPILGSLLAGALTSDGGAGQLTAGMAGFGLALALPFAAFAAFPGWLNTLPRSGGWLNTVKVTLGFLELALALKFLSNADLVKHWGVLKIEPFLGLWLIIFLGLALYLFGLIRFPHDAPPARLSAGRRALGVLSLAFAAYLATGFIYDRDLGTYRPLKLLSGLAPPTGYSFFHPNDCPQNLNCFKDLNEGLAYARQVNKPVMLDFTGYACVNCRKMEEHVWPENQVYAQLRDDYVLISLYVDDKKELPGDQQVVVERATGGQRQLRTYGQKWAHFQTEFFRANSQPFYVLISPEGELLNHPVGYTPDPEEYARFLECGREAFRELSELKSSGAGQDARRLGRLEY